MANKGIKNILDNSIVRMILALAVAGAASGIILVFVYNDTMPKIEANIKAATNQAIKDIFYDDSQIETTDIKDVYRVNETSGKLQGYAFLAKGNGYQGVIKLIVGVNADISGMKGIEVLESQETPGLGAEIANDGFKKQFAKLPITHSIEYVKNQPPQKPYQIEAITGATISSRAVVNILNKRIEELRVLLKK